MNVFDFIPQYSKMLHNLDQWLDKATAHATAKKFDVDTLVHARLAPDQYALVRQVQSACDAAKFSAAYLSGKEPPVHPDTETTIAELRARIQSCRAFLETVSAGDLEGAEDRKVAPKFMRGKWAKGDQFLLQMSLPNFYFHVTTAYAILRHNGVDIGKTDFIGAMPMHD
ncbi:MAG: hypothetical protein JWM53_2676 [bacterium]|nr:hypothetical protein [bacterium]